MAKYNKNIVEKIANLIREDSYTIAELCDKVNISKDTYYRWLAQKADFSDAIKKAEEDFNALIIVEAKRSLIKLIKGYTVQEKKTVTADTGKKDDEGKPIIRVKEHSVVDKHYQPNTAAVIFALTNRDPANWKNRLNNEMSGEVAIKSDLERMSNEELQRIVDGDKQP
jgi:transcriptional regulator with XRE-family HTH domain